VKRTPRPDELKLWSRVTATIRPAPGQTASILKVDQPSGLEITLTSEKTLKREPLVVRSFKAPSITAPQAIEPGRMRRLTREREVIGPKLDLHGLDQDRAHIALTTFLRRARGEGWRAVLVITGKGTRGEGVLRRRVPEWLAEPPLRDFVAGVSSAHRRHGGDGALYVVLKRTSQS
jgi:DNA-nicking Smr family endonuclease